MIQKFKFEDTEYSSEDISQSNMKRLILLQFSQQKLQELQDNQALLNKAKNSYIADLKAEIVKGKLGIDIGGLLTD